MSSHKVMIFIPNLVCVLTKGDGDIATAPIHPSVHPSVCPSHRQTNDGDVAIASICPSILSVTLSSHKTIGRNPTKFGVRVTHMNRALESTFSPTPWGAREGPKGQISYNFNCKVNFKDFDTKHCMSSHK